MREPRLARAGMALVNEWVRRLRLPDILVVTNDKAHARLFRAYGFKDFRLILRNHINYDQRN